MGWLSRSKPKTHGVPPNVRRGTKLRSSRSTKAQTAGVVCRKDKGVLDEIPGAYKDIRSVMAAQSDLVDILAEFHPRIVRMAGRDEVDRQEGG